jgi:hypothetical protein
MSAAECEHAVQLEIKTNGPVGTQVTIAVVFGAVFVHFHIAAFETCYASQITVYTDFALYKTGVYTTNCSSQPQTGRCQAWGHAVKIIGIIYL